jgi:peptidoglycan L-alanyl-D-glutamate endopeptidase CwlK
LLIRFFFFAVLLVSSQACGQTTAPDSLAATPPWDDRGCDTTRRVTTLRLYDLAQPFYLLDTLQALLTAPPKVFAVIRDSTGHLHWTHVGGTSAGVPGWQRLPTDSTDRTYLWALADEPQYLYSRWEPLLDTARRSFLTRRDALLDSLRKRLPRYQIRVISDLRSANTQSKYLRRGSSSAAVSLHQFGLAADIGMFGRGRLVRNAGAYGVLGELAPAYGLVWGGNFVGFVDPPHIQAYYNSAAVVEAFPVLRFEFEPFRPHYLSKVRRFVADGRDDQVLDTAALLTRLNDLRRDQPCPCTDSLRVPPTYPELGTQLARAGYQPGTDLLLVGDIPAQSMTLLLGDRLRLTRRLGRWR